MNTLFDHVMDTEEEAIFECTRCGALVREERFEQHTDYHNRMLDILRPAVTMMEDYYAG